MVDNLPVASSVESDGPVSSGATSGLIVSIPPVVLSKSVELLGAALTFVISETETMNKIQMSNNLLKFILNCFSVFTLLHKQQLLTSTNFQ